VLVVVEQAAAHMIAVAAAVQVPPTPVGVVEQLAMEQELAQEAVELC
jgi:hypothetical protein